MFWRELTAAHQPTPDATLAGVGTVPSRTSDVARTLTEAGAATGVTTELASRPALGLHTARLTGPPDAVAKAFEGWRGQLLDLGASVVLHERPAEVDALSTPSARRRHQPACCGRSRSPGPRGRCARAGSAHGSPIPVPERTDQP